MACIALHFVAMQWSSPPPGNGLRPPLWPGSEQESSAFPNSTPLVMVSQLLTIFKDVPISGPRNLSPEFKVAIRNLNMSDGVQDPPLRFRDFTQLAQLLASDGGERRCSGGG